MTTTDHAVEAEKWLEYSGNLNPDLDAKAMHAAALAQSEATLAVAHELRTANLIAVVERAAHTIDVTAWPTSRVGRLNAAQHDIAARLGLDGGAE